MGNSNDVQFLVSSNQNFSLQNISQNLSHELQKLQPSTSYTKRPKQNSFGTSFVPLQMKISKNWMTCCLISPFLALASPIYLVDQHQDFKTECSVVIDNGQQIEKIPVVKVVPIKKRKLCLLVLQKPIQIESEVKIGSIKIFSSLKENNLMIVNYPQLSFNKNVKKHIQRAKHLNLEHSKNQGSYVFSNEDITGSFIYLTSCRLTVVVGIQINQAEALLFDKKICKSIQKSVNEQLKQHKNGIRVHQTQNYENLYPYQI